jgi:uncharacterized protein YjdB
MVPSPPDAGPSIPTLVVRPSGINVPRGIPIQLSATVEGTGAPTPVVLDARALKWSVMPPTAGTVDAAGRFTGNGRGEVLLEAIAEVPQAPSLSLRGRAMLNVIEVKVTALTLDPPAATLSRGASTAFRATALYSDGSRAVATDLLEWTVREGRIAVVSNTPGTRGQVTAGEAGRTTISASWATTGLQASAPIEVTAGTMPPLPVKLAISPPTLSGRMGESIPVRATATDATGRTVDVTKELGVRWSTSLSSIATAMPGTVQCTGTGQAVLTVTHMGASAQAPITCTSSSAGEVVAILLTPGGETSVALGRDLSFKARAFTATDTMVGRDVTAQATWSSSAEDVLQSRGGGSVRPVAKGTATISATFGGKTGTTTVTVF